MGELRQEVGGGRPGERGYVGGWGPGRTAEAPPAQRLQQGASRPAGRDGGPGHGCPAAAVAAAQGRQQH